MSDYMQELEGLGDKITKVTGIGFEVVSYAGGVPGISSVGKIDSSRHQELTDKLTGMFGEPKVKERWFSGHTRDVSPLEWKITPEMESSKPYHVLLISMMQRPSKRYLIISSM